MLHRSSSARHSCHGFVAYFSVASQSGCVALAGRVEPRMVFFDASCICVVSGGASSKTATTPPPPPAFMRDLQWFLPAGLPVSVTPMTNDTCEARLPASYKPTTPHVRILVAPPCLLADHDCSAAGNAPFVALPARGEAMRSCIIVPASWQAWRRSVGKLKDTRQPLSAPLPVASGDEQRVTRWWSGDAVRKEERATTLDVLDTSDLLTNLL